MGMLSSFLRPERAYQKAQGQMENYYNQGQAQLQPFANQGQDAYGGLSQVMQSLLNPQQLQSDWAKGYEASPYSQQLQEMSTNSGLEAAGAMGMTGSTPALQAIQAGNTQIGNADRMNYMDNLMQKYLAGAGVAQNIYGQGAQSANQMSQNTMNQGQNIAQIAYGQSAAPGNLFGSLLGMGTGLVGSALGGPIGGAMANKFGSWMTGGR